MIKPFLTIAAGRRRGTRGDRTRPAPAPSARCRSPPPRATSCPPPRPQVAVFAGGCFWGMEAVFERVKGVTAVTSGYAGGTAATANYDQVSTERPAMPRRSASSTIRAR